MVSDAEPQKWEVWHARCEYDGKRDYKYRPVIMVRKNVDFRFLVNGEVRGACDTINRRLPKRLGHRTPFKARCSEASCLSQKFEHRTCMYSRGAVGGRATFHGAMNLLRH